MKNKKVKSIKECLGYTSDGKLVKDSMIYIPSQTEMSYIDYLVNKWNFVTNLKEIKCKIKTY